MNTAVMFVELLACGVGALGWLALLLASASNIDPGRILDWVMAASTGGIAALALVAYMIGVCFDRVADIVFSWFRDRWTLSGRVVAFLTRRHDTDPTSTRLRVAASVVRHK